MSFYLHKKKVSYFVAFFDDEEASSNALVWIGKRAQFEVDSKKPYCYVCNRQFSRAKSLRRHHQVVHALFPKVFACKWCPRSYNRKDNLKQHVNLCHLDMLKENS